MSWERIRLGDCCEITSSKRIFYSEYTDYGIPFYRSKEIIEFSQGQSISEPLYIANQRYHEIKNRFGVPVAGDMLLTSVGTIGIPYIVKETDEFYFKDGNLTWFRNFTSKLCARYLYYWVISKEGNGVLNNTTIGSSQKALTISALKNVEITVPSIGKQRRIADILSAYDDLIENNRKQIKLLKEAAQRLYKEWFVDLRFPGHEHTKIVDGVPEGWDRMPVGSLIGKIDRTKQIPTSEYLPNGKIPVIDQSREFIAGYTNDVQAIVKSKVPIIVFGDHTRILKLIQFPFAKGADGTQLIISAYERMPQRLLYCSLMNIDLSNYHYARHFKYLKSEIILLPSKGIADDFEKITDPIFKKIQSCRDQCCWGQEARDRLLPKLMSGEVEV